MRKLPTGVKTCFYSDRGAHSHTQGVPRVNCAPASGVPHPDLAAAPSIPTHRPSTPSTHTCNGAAPSQAPRSGSEAAPSRTSRHQTADRESCARAVAMRKPKLQNWLGRSPHQKVQKRIGLVPQDTAHPITSIPRLRLAIRCLPGCFKRRCLQRQPAQ